MKTYLLLSLLLIPLSILLILLFLNLGNWFRVADPLPANLDVIFTFGGEVERDIYSRKLAERFPHATWVVSGRNRKGYFARLQKSGFDTSRVVFVDTCEDTRNEVNYIATWVEEHGKEVSNPSPTNHALGIGLVSGPYHMRRIKMMADKNFQHLRIKPFYLPVPMERYGWKENAFVYWWKTRSISTVFMIEIAKMINASIFKTAG